MSFDGILLIDKQGGWTSHDVVAKARRLTGQRRIGHTGTLDPMATGLLVLCLGQATRLVEHLTAHDKQYTGVIQLGARTTTDDAEGETLETRAVAEFEPARLRELEREFSGEIEQVPPAYSAIKVAGQRAYKAARAGVALHLEARRVRIDRLRLEAIGAERLALEVTCGPGTYVRSLARDIGEALGCGGHLVALRRERVGSFAIVSSITLDALAGFSAIELQEALRPMDEGLAGTAVAVVTAERGRQLRQGAVLAPRAANWISAPMARIYDANGEFIAVGEVAPGGEIRGRKVFGGTSGGR